MLRRCVTEVCTKCVLHIIVFFAQVRHTKDEHARDAAQRIKPPKQNKNSPPLRRVQIRQQPPPPTPTTLILDPLPLRIDIPIPIHLLDDHHCLQDPRSGAHLRRHPLCRSRCRPLALQDFKGPPALSRAPTRRRAPVLALLLVD